ncbi:universal stress protein [Streptomyces sp. NPDC088124]|uniref:universal stress protein n=1 Tax=Streptomyces sp. NPDC088124 TaxID=3154654 RepID=UPI00342361F9
MSDEAASTGRIMAGGDGSEQSKAALRWAVAQAELTGGVVEAVFAWQNPYYWYGWSPPEEGPFDFDKQARSSLARAIIDAIGLDQPVRVTQRVMEGNPARALLDAVQGADLLVVGNRGHRGFTHALPGSVGQHCVQHAPYPVVVIRGAEIR